MAYLKNYSGSILLRIENDQIKESFLQLVTENEYTQDNQMQGGIIYQIYVDSMQL